MTGTRVPPRVAMLAAASAAALGVASSWGFTVDDALISARVAHHIAVGEGYRFNAGGPIVDCVTPLGWAHVLAPLAAKGAWSGMLWASGLGAVAWICAAAWLGRRCAQACSGWTFWALLAALAACLPLGAWASAGMETAILLALGVAALAPGARGAAAAGAAAAWRPELAPWAAVLVFIAALGRGEPPPRRALLVAIAVAPALAVAGVRLAIFGRAVPLAVFAKPSDALHGLRYVFGTLVLAGPAYLCVAGARSYRALPRASWAIGAAFAVHLLVLLGVGGDWMSFWRLAAPTFPSLFLLGAEIAQQSSAWPNAARLGAAFMCSALLHTQLGPEARSVRDNLLRVMREAAPMLDGAQRVASVDIGWVGASGRHDVVDLSGVTDPEIAFYAGGHTTKRLPMDFLVRRDADAIVQLVAKGTPPGEPPIFRYGVDRRVMQMRGMDRFEPVGRVALDARWEYRVLRRVPAPSGATP